MSYIKPINNIGVTLTDATTITWNFAQGNIAYLTIAGNRTLIISNMLPNTLGILLLTQDSTGSRTLSLPSPSKMENGFSLSTAANAQDILSVFFDGTTYYWSIRKNFA